MKLGMIRGTIGRGLAYSLLQRIESSAPDISRLCTSNTWGVAGCQISGSICGREKAASITADSVPVLDSGNERRVFELFETLWRTKIGARVNA